MFTITWEKSEAYGRAISHWTARELAEVMQQCIVETISPRHVERLMIEVDLKPYQSQYWLNPPDPNFEEKVNDICERYLEAMRG